MKKKAPPAPQAEIDPAAAKIERRRAEILAKADSDYALVTSLHPRSVEAGGLTIRYGKWSPVCRADGAERYADIIGAGYLRVVYISEEAYARAYERADVTPAETAPSPETSRLEALTRENAQLRNDLAAAHREIGLLTGRRTGGTGPREGNRDDNSPPV